MSDESWEFAEYGPEVSRAWRALHFTPSWRWFTRWLLLRRFLRRLDELSEFDVMIAELGGQVDAMKRLIGEALAPAMLELSADLVDAIGRLDLAPERTAARDVTSLVLVVLGLGFLGMLLLRSVGA